jgi:hypothetical protein
LTPDPIITVQYLEAAPELANLDASAVVEKLSVAYERLPFSHLLIGWELPPSLLEACRVQAENLGVRFLRWHPLLTGDGTFQPRSLWQVIGLSSRPVVGFRDMTEFTFVCPNNPEVQEAIQRRVESLLADGVYQGFFLDRIRFPSPASDPAADLGCFCLHCQRLAEIHDLDLEEVRRVLVDLVAQPYGRLRCRMGCLAQLHLPSQPDRCTIGALPWLSRAHSINLSSPDLLVCCATPIWKSVWTASPFLTGMAATQRLG